MTQPYGPNLLQYYKCVIIIYSVIRILHTWTSNKLLNATLIIFYLVSNKAKTQVIYKKADMYLLSSGFYFLKESNANVYWSLLVAENTVVLQHGTLYSLDQK